MTPSSEVMTLRRGRNVHIIIRNITISMQYSEQWHSYIHN